MGKGRNHVTLMVTLMLLPALSLMPSILMAESNGNEVVGKGRILTSVRLTRTSLDKIAIEGDYLYDTRDETDHADKAIRLYKKILEIDPKNHEALWKLSRSYNWRGDMATSSEKQLAAYRAAMECAKQAISLNPETIGGHLMLGISYGRIGETKGILASLHLISLIKREMNIVLAKDPQNEIAHLVLGILYREVPAIYGGSLKKSIMALKEAVRTNPHRTKHYLELAKSYLKKGEKEAARRSLQGLFAITNPMDHVQSEIDRIAADALLASLS